MTDVLMPALSPTMEEGTLAKWHVKVGDKVSSGDVIAEIETDKATMEVEAVDEGKIGKIVVPEGTDNVKVNSVIAVLLTEGEWQPVVDATERREAAPGSVMVQTTAAVSAMPGKQQRRTVHTLHHQSPAPRTCNESVSARIERTAQWRLTIDPLAKKTRDQGWRDDEPGAAERK